MIGESMTVWMVRVLHGLIALLPLRVAMFMGSAVGTCAAWLVPRRREAYANIKSAFGTSLSPAERKKMARRVIRHLAQNAVEMFQFSKLKTSYIRDFVEVTHRERYEAIAASQKGALLITPHFGNWELTQILSGLVGRPLHVLARRQKHSKLDTYLNKIRASQGARPILKGNAVRELIRTLKGGGMAGVLGDLSGGRAGTVVRFFGRKTTAPAGIFQIARRTGTAIVPCFMVRLKGPYHRIVIEEPFFVSKTADEKQDVEEALGRYYRMLEHWIRRYPDQWLWVYKRWKYSFTKRIAVLCDEKTGHTNQVRALANEVERIKEQLGRDYEFRVDWIHVRFKNFWKRRLFYALSWFYLPFAQGRLGFLRFFLVESSAQAIQKVSCDYVVSAGTSLVPINLALRRENCAKSITLMRPSFPYQTNQFDLCFVPKHDILRKENPNVVRTLITPSPLPPSGLGEAASKLRKRASIPESETRFLAVFIGGEAKSYFVDTESLRSWLVSLKQFARDERYQLLVTTSRRTSPELEQVTKAELERDAVCSLLIIANEANIDGSVHGLLGMSEAAVFTEDSISMMSEAVCAGRRLVIVKHGHGRLRDKYRRFQTALEASHFAVLADSNSIYGKVKEILDKPADNRLAGEQTVLRKPLEKMFRVHAS